MTAAGDDPQPELELHQRSILQACTHGGLAGLQGLFQARNVHKGDTEVYLRQVTKDGPPATMCMIILAVENDQLAVLDYLLSVYQGVDLERYDIAYAIIKTKSPDMLKLVIQQSPGICSMEIEHLNSTFLTELCREGPDASQLVQLLLDHGADVNVGGLLMFSSLGMAIQKKLPVDILRRMLDLGAHWGASMVAYAISLGRVDAVRLMLERWRRPLIDSEEKSLQDALKKCNDKEIIKMTDEFIRKKQIGYGKTIYSTVMHFGERLARITMPQLPQSRETEKEQTSKKEETFPKETLKTKTEDDDDDDDDIESAGGTRRESGSVSFM